MGADFRIQSAFYRRTGSCELVTDAPTLPSPCRSRHSITRVPLRGLELDRALAHSRDRAPGTRSEFQSSVSASSRKHEHDPKTSEPRAPAAFSASERRPETGLRAAKHLEQAGTSRAPALRAGERPASVRGRAEAAWSSPSAHSSPSDFTPAFGDTGAGQRPRSASSHAARTTQLSTNRERPDCRAPTQ